MSSTTSTFSFSGFSGLFIGFIGLVVVYLISMMTNNYWQASDGLALFPVLFIEIGIIIITVFFTIVSLLILWYRGKKRAKLLDQKLWNSISKKQRINLIISIVLTLIILILVANKGYYSIITPLVLFFYGLVFLNLSRLNSKSLLLLGVLEIDLAVLAYFIYDTEIIFLAIGFGILPILYGLIFFNKNKKATEN